MLLFGRILLFENLIKYQRDRRSAFPTHVGMNRGYYIPRHECDAFPTHVGMNRISIAKRYSDKSVPHTRGDEPNDIALICL